MFYCINCFRLNAVARPLRNLFPIIAVVISFQLVVLQQLPDNTLSNNQQIAAAVGVALFLQGLELSIFPVGKSLSNQFARRGSLPILLSFGFAMGLSAVVAEPALIAVAQQAQEISEGRINALALRLLVAFSVGAVVAPECFCRRLPAALVHDLALPSGRCRPGLRRTRLRAGAIPAASTSLPSTIAASVLAASIR